MRHARLGASPKIISWVVSCCRHSSSKSTPMTRPTVRRRSQIRQTGLGLALAALGAGSTEDAGPHWARAARGAGSTEDAGPHCAPAAVSAGSMGAAGRTDEAGAPRAAH